METSNCANCGQLPVVEFYTHHKKGYQSICKKCKAVYNKEHYKVNRESYKASAKQSNTKIRKETKEYIYNFLLVNPCIHCGEPDPVVLDFHHIDKLNKRFTVSAAKHCSLVAVKKEVLKCEVLCANCHRRHHAKELEINGVSSENTSDSNPD